MSRNDWEYGEITLPRAAIVPIRRAIVARNNELADTGLRIAKEAWGKATAAQKRDNRALTDLVDHVVGRRRDPWAEIDDPATERAMHILDIYYGNTTPRPPQKQNAGHLGTTETAFHTSDLSVSFDAKTGVMTWDISENNHAVERGRTSWLGQVVIRELGQVKWTRGTGGSVSGNNEYNEDPDSGGHGRGPSYTAVAYGPRGAEADPSQTEPYTTSDGTRVTREMLWAMQQKKWDQEARDARRTARAYASGPQGRVSAGTSRGGQYAAHTRTAPFGSLR